LKTCKKEEEWDKTKGDGYKMCTCTNEVQYVAMKRLPIIEHLEVGLMNEHK
jgi:hypothetical protein